VTTDLRAELVVNPRTGEVSQAGADGRTGAWVVQFRQEAEADLFLFATAVLGLDRLTETLHYPVCQWLQRVPPYRKCYLLPRDHLKTSIARALTMHLLLQPRETNVYFPGCRKPSCALGVRSCTEPTHRHDGANTRILYAGETSTNAEHQLRWIMGKFETNPLLRALWPHRCWANPQKEAKKWNESEMAIPRSLDFPESSIETIGVGGAVVGRHYDVMVKDDLITEKAANSPVVMETASEWHKSSRALFDHPDLGLEFILGTRWAPKDIYEELAQTDPTVEVMTRAVVEGPDHAPIFPEMFTKETIARLQRELGPRFFLLYMNNALSKDLTDFDTSEIRTFTLGDGQIVFEEDIRDTGLLQQQAGPPPEAKDAYMNQPLTPAAYDRLRAKHEYLRFRGSGRG